MFKNIRNKYNEFGEKHPNIKEWFETFIFVIVMVIIIRYFIFEIRWIPSGSMKPTLVEGDRIIVERVTQFYKKPSRGDILVFYPPFVKLNKTPLGILERRTGIACNDIAFIKRVVGLPGDKIEIKKYPDGKNKVLINDKPLDEPYILKEIVELFVKELGKNIKLNYGKRASRVREIQDPTSFEKVLPGWKCNIKLVDGLLKMMEDE